MTISPRKRPPAFARGQRAAIIAWEPYSSPRRRHSIVVPCRLPAERRPNATCARLAFRLRGTLGIVKVRTAPLGAGEEGRGPPPPPPPPCGRGGGAGEGTRPPPPPPTT